MTDAEAGIRWMLPQQHDDEEVEHRCALQSLAEPGWWGVTSSRR